MATEDDTAVGIDVDRAFGEFEWPEVGGVDLRSDRYAMDPFGEGFDTTNLSAEAKGNPFRFQGHYLDEDTDTYDMQARSYRPLLGRFLTQDRFESPTADQGLQVDPSLNNRYGFAGGNPTTRVELDGHKNGGPSGDGPSTPLGRKPSADERQTRRRSIKHINTSRANAERSIAQENAQIAGGHQPPRRQLLAEEANRFLNAYRRKHDLTTRETENLASVFQTLTGSADADEPGWSRALKSIGITPEVVGTSALPCGFFCGALKSTVGRAATVVRRVLPGRGTTAARGGAAIARYDADFAMRQVFAGRTAKVTEWARFADAQGWQRVQSGAGPLKFRDANGVDRLVIKRGSERTPGSERPDIAIRDAGGTRVDTWGNPVTRRSPGNHTPVEWDLP